MHILLIGNLATDIIKYPKAVKPVIRPGGPLLWIKKVLRDYRHQIIELHSDKPAEVIITVMKNGETGYIKRNNKISSSIPKHSQVIISTIGDEFNLSKIANLQGEVALDVQGYCRTLKSGEKFQPPKNVWQRLNILKATEIEAKKCSAIFLRDQKKRILLITKGSNGFDLYTHGVKKTFAVKQILARNTLGAGDTFFAHFCYFFWKTNSAEQAAYRAQSRVELFLSQIK